MRPRPARIYLPCVVPRAQRPAPVKPSPTPLDERSSGKSVQGQRWALEASGSVFGRAPGGLVGRAERAHRASCDWLAAEPVETARGRPATRFFGGLIARDDCQHIFSGSDVGGRKPPSLFCADDRILATLTGAVGSRRCRQCSWGVRHTYSTCLCANRSCSSLSRPCRGESII